MNMSVQWLGWLPEKLSFIKLAATKINKRINANATVFSTSNDAQGVSLTFPFRLMNSYILLLNTLSKGLNLRMLSITEVYKRRNLTYRNVSNIRRTKSQNLSVSHLGLQLS